MHFMYYLDKLQASNIGSGVIMSLCRTSNIKSVLWVHSTHKHAISFQTTSETTTYIAL
jgi:hypothetical protein